MKDLIIRLIIKPTKEGVEKLKSQVENIGKTGAKVGKDFVSGFNASLSKIPKQVVDYFTSIKGVISSIIGGAIVKGLSDITQQYQEIFEQLRFHFPEDEAKAYLNTLKRIAVETNAPLQQVAQTFLTFKNILGEEGALRFTDNLFKIADTIGESADAVADFVQNLLIAIGTGGEFAGRDVAQLLRQNTQYAKFIADQMGLTTQQLIEGVEKGVINLQSVIDVFTKELDLSKIQDYTTVFDEWVGIWEQIKAIVGEVITYFLSGFSNVAVAIKKWLQENEVRIKGFLIAVGTLYKTIWEFISGIIGTVAKLLWPAIREIAKGIVVLIISINNFWISLFELIYRGIENLINRIKEFIAWLINLFEKIGNVIPIYKLYAEGLRKVSEGLDVLKQKAKDFTNFWIEKAKEIKKGWEIVLRGGKEATIEVKGEVKAKLPSLQQEKVKGEAKTLELDVKDIQLTPDTKERLNQYTQQLLNELQSNLQQQTKSLQQQITETISKIPSTAIIENLGLIFATNFINELQSQGEELGRVLGRAIKEGSTQELEQNLTNALIQSIVASLSLLQPQLAPLFAVLGGLLSELLTPSPELETTLQKSTEFRQEINIYIERADISDKGFWEDLVMNKITPAMNRLKPNKQGWGV